MSARNADLGTVLTAAALIRLKRVADASTRPHLDALEHDASDGTLAGLGDQWVEVMRVVQALTKDTQHTQQVLTAALNRATREARREP